MCKTWRGIRARVYACSASAALAAICALGGSLQAAAAAEGSPPPSEAAVVPGPQLHADGIPPIPRTLAERVAAYTEFRAHGFVDWHPTRREMLVRHRTSGSNTAQLHLLRSPGGALEPLTNFPEPIVTGAFDPAAGRYVVYARDAGGNEATQIWRLDLAADGSAPPAPQPVLLSSPGERTAFLFNRKGDRLLLVSVPLDRTAQGGRRDAVATTLTLVDPLQPDQRRTVAVLPGTGWTAFRFAPDDASLVCIRFKSATESSVWRLDVATGRPRQLLPAAGSERKASYDGFEFSPDGRSLYLVTDEGGEFRQLAAYDFASGGLRLLSAHIAWDVEDFKLSEDGRHLLTVVNADGNAELHWFDPATGREAETPAAASLGAVTGGGWHHKRNEYALTRSSAHSPGDVFSVDPARGTLERWTTAAAAVDPSGFATPQIVRWTSFDGRGISGVLYLPPARFTGRRPVVISIHGGPEAQSTVHFMGRMNYLLDELGVAVLEPNVRGSSGYGKSFLDLDNGPRREDAVKDIGALLDWLPSHPRLDAGRVMVLGGSYGGYMTLASLVHYSERLRGGVDIVGISNFLSFLERTESYRRDLRRAEYGDERDPAMRAFLEQASPIRRAERIKAPLFVVHGKNDPRVPVGEAEQIVTRVRGSGSPVWYLLADDEGHGYARKANADYLFYCLVRFVETHLRPAGP